MIGAARQRIIAHPTIVRAPFSVDLCTHIVAAMRLNITSPEGQVVAKVLLEQAQQCWRLANSIYNQEIAAELEAYARQLEERAACLEEEITPPPPRAAASPALILKVT